MSIAQYIEKYQRILSSVSAIMNRCWLQTETENCSDGTGQSVCVYSNSGADETRTEKNTESTGIKFTAAVEIPWRV